MNINRSIAAIAIATGLAIVAAQATPTSGHSKHLLMQDVSYKGSARLDVTSPSFKDGALIPYKNTQYRGNVFPGLDWSHGPAGTRSYVMIFQGFETAGQHAGGTVIALTVFNIPASINRLDVGMTTPPAGATLGPNVRGTDQPYAGPHVKVTGKHTYVIQVFALDTLLPASSTMTYDQLAAAMTGHVVAVGVLHGLSNKDPTSKDD